MSSSELRIKLLVGKSTIEGREVGVAFCHFRFTNGALQIGLSIPPKSATKASSISTAKLPIGVIGTGMVNEAATPHTLGMRTKLP